MKEERGDENYKICNHAEQNAICQCAKHGIRTEGSIVYITMYPCMSCAKMIFSAGILDVVVPEDRNNQCSDGIVYLGDRGIYVTRLL